MGCGSSGTQQTTTSSQPPPQVMQAYTNLLNRANTVANQPLQQYQGQLVAPFNQTQNNAFGEINNAQGIANPFIGSAAGYAQRAATPIDANQMYGYQQLPGAAFGFMGGANEQLSNAYSHPGSAVTGADLGAAFGNLGNSTSGFNYDQMSNQTINSVGALANQNLAGSTAGLNYPQYDRQALSQLPGQSVSDISGSTAGFGAASGVPTSGLGTLGQVSSTLGSQAIQGLPGQAISNLGQSTQDINVPQYSSNYLNTFTSPYTQQVAEATRRQMDESNAEQQQQVVGNAISKGAWGGDRAGIAQAELARQQSLAEGQVLGGINQQGFQQAQQQLNTQQQLALQTGQTQASLQQGAAGQEAALFGQQQNAATAAAEGGLGFYGQQAGLMQGAGGQLASIFGQNQQLGLTAAQQQAALEQGASAQQLGYVGQQQQMGLQAGEAQAGLQQGAAGQELGFYGGQQQLGLTTAQQQAQLAQQSAGQLLGEYNTQQQAGIGAQEATGWLNQNTGFAMGNLGNEALQTALTGSSAQMQAGGLQQQLAQEQLNIPYEQYLQQQAYPFQTTGWLGGLTEGMGSSAGGMSSTTAPGASTGSQLAGLGVTGLGVIGATGGFGSNGWVSNMFANRGGRIGVREPTMYRPRRDAGGIVPDVSVSFIPQQSSSLRGAGPPRPPPAVQQQNSSGMSSGTLNSLAPLLRSGSGSLASGHAGGAADSFNAGGAGDMGINSSGGIYDLNSPDAAASSGWLDSAGSGVGDAFSSAGDWLGGLFMNEGGTVAETHRAHRSSGGPGDPDVGGFRLPLLPWYAKLASSAVPGLGTLSSIYGTGANIYNTESNASMMHDMGMPLSFWQQAGGVMGLNDYNNSGHNAFNSYLTGSNNPNTMDPGAPGQASTSLNNAETTSAGRNFLNIPTAPGDMSGTTQQTAPGTGDPTTTVSVTQLPGGGGDGDQKTPGGTGQSTAGPFIQDVHGDPGQTGSHIGIPQNVGSGSQGGLGDMSGLGDMGAGSSGLGDSGGGTSGGSGPSDAGFGGQGSGGGGGGGGTIAGHEDPNAFFRGGRLHRAFGGISYPPIANFGGEPPTPATPLGPPPPGPQNSPWPQHNGFTQSPIARFGGAGGTSIGGPQMGTPDPYIPPANPGMAPASFRPPTMGTPDPVGAFGGNTSQPMVGGTAQMSTGQPVPGPSAANAYMMQNLLGPQMAARQGMQPMTGGGAQMSTGQSLPPPPPLSGANQYQMQNLLAPQLAAQQGMQPAQFTPPSTGGPGSPLPPNPMQPMRGNPGYTGPGSPAPGQPGIPRIGAPRGYAGPGSPTPDQYGLPQQNGFMRSPIGTFPGEPPTPATSSGPMGTISGAVNGQRPPIMMPMSGGGQQMSGAYGPMQRFGSGMMPPRPGFMQTGPYRYGGPQNGQQQWPQYGTMQRPPMGPGATQQPPWGNASFGAPSGGYGATTGPARYAGMPPPSGAAFGTLATGGHVSGGGSITPEHAYTGFDGGGQIMNAGSTGSGDPAAMGSPVVGNQLQQFQSMPIEKLQELAVRMPPGSPQGAMIQRAIQMRQMNPMTGIQAPVAGAGIGPPPPGLATGGRARFADAGVTGDDQTSVNAGPTNAPSSDPSMVDALSVPKLLGGKPDTTTMTVTPSPSGVSVSSSDIGSPGQPSAFSTQPSATLAGNVPSSLNPTGAAIVGAGQLPYPGASPEPVPVVGTPPSHADLAKDAPQNSEIASNPWMALVAAGLGMMSSRNPTVLGGIGEGAMQGLGYLEGQQKQENVQRQAAQGAKFKQAELDQAAAALSQHGQQSAASLAELKREHDLNASHQTAQEAQAAAALAETSKYHQGELGLRGQALDLEGKKIDQDKYTAMPWTQPDPNDPTKQVQGVLYTAKNNPADTKFVPVAGVPVSKVDPSMAGFGALGNVAQGQAPSVTGEGFLKTLDPKIATQVKALSEGRMAFPTGYAMTKPYWQNMVAAVSQFDPSFDAIDYGARAKTRNSFSAGPDSQNVASINTAIWHLGRLQESATALDNTTFPLVNRVLNWGVSATGDPRVARFQTDANAVSNELTRVFRGTGGSETDVQSWKNELNAAGSPEQQQAVINEGVQLLNSRLEAVAHKYNQGMGTAKQPMEILSPEAQKVYTRLTGQEPSATEAGPKAKPTTAPTTGTAANPLIPKTQADINNAPSGTVIMTPTGPQVKP